MKSIQIQKKKAYTNDEVIFLLKIDGIEYELPYRIKTVIDFEETLIVLAYPEYPTDDYTKYEQEGRTSLFALDKKSKEIIWTRKKIWKVWRNEIKTEFDFVTKKGYEDYIKLYKNRDTVIAQSDDWEIVLVVKSGEEIISWAIK